MSNSRERPKSKIGFLQSYLFLTTISQHQTAKLSIYSTKSYKKNVYIHKFTPYTTKGTIQNHTLKYKRLQIDMNYKLKQL